MSGKVDKNLTKQVRIDAGLHRLLKIESGKRDKSIKTLVEALLGDFLEVKDDR